MTTITLIFFSVTTVVTKRPIYGELFWFWKDFTVYNPSLQISWTLINNMYIYNHARYTAQKCRTTTKRQAQY